MSHSPLTEGESLISGNSLHDLHACPEGTTGEERSEQDVGAQLEDTVEGVEVVHASEREELLDRISRGLSRGLQGAIPGLQVRT